MTTVVTAVRGMGDVVPSDSPYWQHVERTAARVLAGYGYREIRLPLVEKTELFRRSIGEATDIVEKEMYTFTDRNGDSLTLRPEATASCVRALIEHGLSRGQAPRLWYAGPMFRHERPQKGRYRQFFQIGAEAFGLAEPAVDAEMILMTARLWRELGLEGLSLEINSLGTPSERAAFRTQLVAYCSTRRNRLDADSQRRLETNPLRILDSKNPETRALLADAPTLPEALGPESREHFSELCTLLDATGIVYTVNPRLVRGLDYYTRMVFEWTTDRLGAQGTVCAGGRYDELVEQIGGPPTPAVGFAFGMERLIELLRANQATPDLQPPDVYLLAVGPLAARQAVALAESLRDELENLTLVLDAGSGSFRTKLKRADRSGARYAVILGDDELANKRISIKNLREAVAQQPLPHAEAVAYLDRALALSRAASGAPAEHRPDMGTLRP